MADAFEAGEMGSGCHLAQWSMVALDTPHGFEEVHAQVSINCFRVTKTTAVATQLLRRARLAVCAEGGVAASYDRGVEAA